MDCKQKKFISWEVQDQSASTSDVWWEPTFWFSDGYFLGGSSYGVEREKKKKRENSKLSQVYFYKGTNLIHEGSTLRTNCPQKTPPPNSITSGILAFSIWLWEDVNIQSMARNQCFMRPDKIISKNILRYILFQRIYDQV